MLCSVTSCYINCSNKILTLGSCKCPAVAYSLSCSLYSFMCRCNIYAFKRIKWWRWKASESSFGGIRFTDRIRGTVQHGRTSNREYDVIGLEQIKYIDSYNHTTHCTVQYSTPVRLPYSVLVAWAAPAGWQGEAAHLYPMPCTPAALPPLVVVRKNYTCPLIPSSPLSRRKVYVKIKPNVS